MRNKQTVNHRIMKKINLRVILNYLRLNGPKSRSDLAKELMLDGTTVTNLVRDLLADDLIVSTGSPETHTRGKPGELLSINPDGKQVIGLSLEENMTITGVLCNLEGNIIYREYVELSGDVQGEKIIKQFNKMTLSLYNYAKQNKLMGISIAIPGIWLEKERLFVRSASIPQLGNFNLTELLSPEIPIEMAYFTGNLPALAEAEMWFADSDNTDDFMYVFLDKGIGAASISNGRLIKGAKGFAGELGHSYVGTDNKCSCGKRGCLETVASLSAINDRFAGEHSLEQQDQTDLEFFDRVIESYNTHDTVTEKLINDVADNIAKAVGNSINLLGPSSIVFGGSLVKLGSRFLNTIAIRLKEYVIPELLKDVTIRKSNLPDDNDIPLGATVQLLKTFFQGEND